MSTANPPFPAPSHDAISRRARELWLSRGEPAGQDEEIWLEAERQLLTALQAKQMGTVPAPTSPRQEKRLPQDEPVIDEAELQARLDSVGRTAQNSPTSLDLT